MRLHIDSWRWAGVPWFLRSGKCLAETAAEVLVELKPPPQALFDDAAPPDGLANYVRFRLAPSPVIALAARVKRAGQEFVGDQRELHLLNAQPDEEEPYERLLGRRAGRRGRALHPRGRGRGRLGGRRPRPREAPPRHPYEPGSWGPKEADDLIAPGPLARPRASTRSCAGRAGDLT